MIVSTTKGLPCSTTSQNHNLYSAALLSFLASFSSLTWLNLTYIALFKNKFTKCFADIKTEYTFFSADTDCYHHPEKSILGMHQY